MAVLLTLSRRAGKLLGPAVVWPAIAGSLLVQSPELHCEYGDGKQGNKRYKRDFSIQDSGISLRETDLAADCDQSQLDTPRHSHGHQQQLRSQDNYAESQSSAKKHSAIPKAATALTRARASICLRSHLATGAVWEWSPALWHQ